MLLDEAEKLYNKLSKELIDETIIDYALTSHRHYQCYRNLMKNNDQLPVINIGSGGSILRKDLSNILCKSNILNDQ